MYENPRLNSLFWSQSKIEKICRFTFYSFYKTLLAIIILLFLPSEATIGYDETTRTAKSYLSLILEFEPNDPDLLPFDIDSITFLKQSQIKKHKKKKNKTKVSSLWTSTNAPNIADIAIAYKQMVGKDADSHCSLIVEALQEMDEFIRFYLN